MMTLIVTVKRTLARTVLIPLDLGQGVPPQVLGLVRRVDDGVWQALFAVVVLGHLAQRIELGQQVALVVVARLPRAAVRVGHLGHQGVQVVVFVGDGAAQRVGFFEQAGELVVLEVQLVAVRQGQADHVAEIVQVDGVAFAAVVAAGDDAVVFVVVNFQLAAQHGGGPAGARCAVIAEVVVLALPPT